MTQKTEQDLIDAAITARDSAYAPYSNFHVGAALVDDQGRMHRGVNVENAAYPLGQCAEASAIGAMVIAGGRKITQLAVAGGGDALCTPCGGCRQKIREFAEDTLEILVCGPEGLRKRTTLGELLPHSFGPDNLSTGEDG